MNATQESVVVRGTVEGAVIELRCEFPAETLTTEERTLVSDALGHLLATLNKNRIKKSE